MVHYLRHDSDSIIETIALESDRGADDISSAMYVVNYSNYLLSLIPEDRETFINTIENLNELREAWWTRDRKCTKTADEFIAEYYRNAAHILGLSYVTD